MLSASEVISNRYRSFPVIQCYNLDINIQNQFRDSFCHSQQLSQVDTYRVIIIKIPDVDHYPTYSEKSLQTSNPFFDAPSDVPLLHYKSTLSHHPMLRMRMNVSHIHFAFLEVTSAKAEAEDQCKSWKAVVIKTEQRT